MNLLLPLVRRLNRLLGIEVALQCDDVTGHHTTFDVTKYRSWEHYLARAPYGTFHGEKNAITPRGKQMLWKIFAGLSQASEYYSTANTYLFVGDSSAANPGTSGMPYDLQGTNKVGQPLIASSPAIAIAADGQTVTINYQATFDQNMANFTWREAGIVNGGSVAGNTPLTNLPASGTLFNRYVAPGGGQVGVKTSGLVWTASLTITLN